MLISAPVAGNLQEQVRAGETPQRDYFAVAQALDATLITPVKRRARKRSRAAKALETLRIAWSGYKERRRYDVIISDVVLVGVALALIFKLLGVRKRHIMIAQGSKLMGRWLSRFVKLARLESNIDRFVVYSPLLAQRLTSVLGVPAHKVAMVWHPADHNFWKPTETPAERMICSAGMYRRDYPTLIDAVRGLDVSVVVAGYSPWVQAQYRGAYVDAPPENVTFGRYSYKELREIYARSMAVALPLENTQNAAGSMVMYEAMSMGKPLIVTRTQGQMGLGVLKEGENCLFVELGDVDGWRQAIQFLCDHPEEAARMGRQARALVDRQLNLDVYTREMTAVVQSLASETRAAARPATR
jgi:glycosyltransferase involved in cell wall biosynthesis